MQRLEIVFCYPIWDQRYHKRYLRVIEALGRSGIPQLKGLRIVYVGAISKSWGEELYIPRKAGEWCEQHVGLTPDVLEKCLDERLHSYRCKPIPRIRRHVSIA